MPTDISADAIADAIDYFRFFRFAPTLRHIRHASCQPLR
jgi:hypothetical protein